MHQNAISKTYQNIMVQKCLECVPRKRSGLGSSRIQRCFFGTIRSEMASPGLDEDRVEGLLTHLAAKCEAKCWVMCAMQWCNGDSPTSLYKNMVVLVRIHYIHIYICYMYIKTWNGKILESQYSSPVGSLTEIFGVQKETHNRRCCIDFAGHRNWCYKLFRKTLTASSLRMKIGALKKDPFRHETHQSG